MQILNSNTSRRLLHRFLPQHFHDPLGLFVRLIRSQDSAAVFAIVTSVLSLLATPLDIVFQIPERIRYNRASVPKLPIIFVTGPPRSGTSLASQVLIDNLPLGYINNLTAVFQRSPITANLLFKKITAKRYVNYKSYYGKTVGFSGPNDGLHIWDRWIGKDRKHVPAFLSESTELDIIRFFGALQQAYTKPIVNKNNNLITYASLIAEVLDNSYFICMTRDPLYLTQSLLEARYLIHGDALVPYGIDSPDKSKRKNNNIDYIEDVCQQTLFYERIIKDQQELIGKNRFWTISYEKLCDKPKDFVLKVSEQILNLKIDKEIISSALKPFKKANEMRLKSEVFNAIQDTLHRLR